MTALKEFIRIVKPGGYISISISDVNLKLNFMTHLETFMQARQIELLSLTFEQYHMDYTKNYEYKMAYYMVCRVLQNSEIIHYRETSCVLLLQDLTHKLLSYFIV